MSSDPPFFVDDAYDVENASDGVSRFGAYLRHNATAFNDGDDQVTPDPVDFAIEAWRVATGPIMAPAYLRIGDGRILAATCGRNHFDGNLLADVTLAVPRPAALTRIAGYGEWDVDLHNNHLEPSEEDLGRGPVMLTTTRLMLPVPTHELFAPRKAPARLSLADASAAVRRLARLLSDQVTPILNALTSGGKP
jgi:hypothetical protein